MGKYYKELSLDFSNEWIPRLQKLYNRVHETQNCSHAWWKYVLHPSRIKEHYLNDFPWIVDIPSYDINNPNNLIIFFLSNGVGHKHVKAHLDPDNIKWALTFPLYNCTRDSVTNWVESKDEKTYFPNPEEGKNQDFAVKNGYDSNVKMLGSTYNILESYAFEKNAALFRGDIWHEVVSNHEREDIRVFGKIWTPELELDYFERLIGDHFV